MMPLETKTPHEIDRSVGLRIREMRIRAGYTQGDVAEALGITFQQVQKYESGMNRISASRLYDLARWLKARPKDFFPLLEAGEAESPFWDLTGLARAAAQLSNQKQRLVLELMRELTRTEAGAGAKDR